MNIERVAHIYRLLTKYGKCFRQAALQAAMIAPIFRERLRTTQAQENYPHVYDSQKQAQHTAGWSYFTTVAHEERHSRQYVATSCWSTFQSYVSPPYS